ncbi:hypothetical protein [Caenimonas soli]|uniref:hypothetical protein n=1 Tax=Caenimonas soli TaxID=2735555 RepID=UPI0015544F26|nr:hypothetical protein [Caenimonas soli]NPC59397.1 hypothetical protein [Caenimonas soli]
MSDALAIVATPWKESIGTCACCGRTSKTIWGDLAQGELTVALYFVQWTLGAPEHAPNIDLVVGPWGDEAKPEHRLAISLLYHPAQGGGSFMVIDGEGRRTDDRFLCGRALKREDVVGTPLAQEVFALVDAVWLTEPRICEVKELDNAG